MYKYKLSTNGCLGSGCITWELQDGAAITDLFNLARLSKQENTLPSSPKEATRNDSTWITHSVVPQHIYNNVLFVFKVSRWHFVRTSYILSLSLLQYLQWLGSFTYWEILYKIQLYSKQLSDIESAKEEIMWDPWWWHVSTQRCSQTCAYHRSCCHNFNRRNIPHLYSFEREGQNGWVFASHIRIMWIILSALYIVIVVLLRATLISGVQSWSLRKQTVTDIVSNVSNNYRTSLLLSLAGKPRR